MRVLVIWYAASTFCPYPPSFRACAHSLCFLSSAYVPDPFIFLHQHQSSNYLSDTVLVCTCVKYCCISSNLKSFGSLRLLTSNSTYLWQGAVSSQEEHVHLKVETAQCKLNLWNPAEITISEIRSSMHANKPYTAALEGIVRGDRSRNPRARAGTVCQTVQEQVDCLLDQATDPNLLGRIYFGWQPWV